MSLRGRSCPLPEAISFYVEHSVEQEIASSGRTPSSQRHLMVLKLRFHNLWRKQPHDRQNKTSDKEWDGSAKPLK